MGACVWVCGRDEMSAYGCVGVCVCAYGCVDVWLCGYLGVAVGAGVGV